jgi:hypothetical protein
VEKNRIVKMFFVMAVLLTLSVLIGCGTSGGAGVKWGSGKDVVYDGPPVAKKGPPPWAPAHGHRKKYKYRYYPDSYVYYDTGRSLYFYIESGDWVVGASLPIPLNNNLGGHVVISMNTDTPYTYHKDHKKKYPPGHVKKNKKKKWAHK